MLQLLLVWRVSNCVRHYFFLFFSLRMSLKRKSQPIEEEDHSESSDLEVVDVDVEDSDREEELPRLKKKKKIQHPSSMAATTKQQADFRRAQLSNYRKKSLQITRGGKGTKGMVVWWIIWCPELNGVHGIEAGLGLAIFSFNPMNFLLRIYIRQHTASIPWTPYNSGHHIIHYSSHYECSGIWFWRIGRLRYARQR